MNRVRIEVWSDYVCPFCFLEEPVLAGLREEFGDKVLIEWRAFELRPDPVPTLDPRGEYLRDTWARAVYPVARERGLGIRLPPVQPRSRLAHEATAYAREQGKADELAHALFTAFFQDGRDIGDREIILQIAKECGLDEAALRQALESGAFGDAVGQEQALAHKLGISGVPALLIYREDDTENTARLLSGAQPFESVQPLVARLLS